MTPVLEVERVSKAYRLGFLRRRRPVIEDLSLEVGEGEIFGFLGPNGAGKTTTIKLIVGLLHPDCGSIRIRGLDGRDPRARQGLGFLPENPYFYDYLTGREFLDFYGQLCGLDRATRRRRAGELLERLGLARAAGLSLRRYSKGMIQRLGLAQALLAEPRLLVLDEPMSGLDPVGRREFRDLLADTRSGGTTVFLSSHILQDAELLCDRVAILSGGRLRSVERLDRLLSESAKGFEVGIDRAGEETIAGRQPVARSAETAVYRVASLDEAEELIQAARASGGRLVSLSPARASLEDAFLERLRARGGGQ